MQTTSEQTELTIAEIKAEIAKQTEIVSKQDSEAIDTLCVEIDAEIASVSNEDTLTKFVKTEIRWNMLDILNEIHTAIAPQLKAMRQASSY